MSDEAREAAKAIREADRRTTTMIATAESEYPTAVDPEKVGSYSPLCKSGGGFYWDEVLEYRVWVHPYRESEPSDGDDWMRAFPTYEEAAKFSEQRGEGAEPPLVLVLQRAWVNQPDSDVFEYCTDERVTEWLPEWLREDNRHQADMTPEHMVEYCREVVTREAHDDDG